MYAFQMVKIIFNHFSLEDNCGKDAVYILEGRTSVGPFCGNDVPPDYQSCGDTVVVHFHSDKGGRKSGLSATVIFVQSILKHTMRNFPHDSRCADNSPLVADNSPLVAFLKKKWT